METERPNLRQEVIDYFAKTVGPVLPRAQVEIVPTTWPPISIHVVPATAEKPYVTLFTTGLSDEPMETPDADDDFAYAELFMRLPADWPIDPVAMLQPDVLWPIAWLRRMAGYPHEESTWLGGPVTIFAASDPPEPIAPGLPFTSFLLLAIEDFVARDGRKVYLYVVSPLHTDERELEIAQGAPALMKAFDRARVSFVVDVRRPSVTSLAPTDSTFEIVMSFIWLGSVVALVGTLIAWIWVPGMGWWSLAAFVAFVVSTALLNVGKTPEKA